MRSGLLTTLVKRSTGLGLLFGGLTVVVSVVLDSYALRPFSFSILLLFLGLLLSLPTGALVGAVAGLVGAFAGSMLRHQERATRARPASVAVGTLLGAALAYVVCLVVFPGIVPLWWLGLSFTVVTAASAYRLAARHDDTSLGQGRN